jgi:predicted Holliday junction resolvase-like endonuclease
MIETIILVCVSVVVVMIISHFYYKNKYIGAKAEIDSKSANIEAIISAEIAEVKIKAEMEKTDLERETRIEVMKLRENLSDAIENQNRSMQEIAKVKADTQLWKANEEKLMHKRIRDARDDALERSRAVLKGKIGEQLAPILDIFPFDVADARFLGAPVDFIVFNGYSDGQTEEVVLVEIKTGKSRLSKRERNIKKVVESGKFRFIEVNIDEGFTITSDFVKDKFTENAE